MINPPRVGGLGVIAGSLEDVVPLEDVFFIGHGDDFGVGEGTFVEGF